MRRLLTALLASTQVALASQTAFSVHDDLLAFPQYEVIFSDTFISDTEASIILEHTSSAVQNAPQSSNTNIESPSNGQTPHSESSTHHAFDPSSETYELMWLDNEPYLCSIPIVALEPKNETSEAAARLAEQKELARATDRGWELLRDLEGNCLYFVSGWWSYSFCYNAEIIQFHQLPQQPGKPPFPPQRDPTTKQYVLGKVKTIGSNAQSKDSKEAKEDEWGNLIDVRDSQRKASAEPPVTELQVKGDTRYLVQKLDGGTICDLTGKPRRVEVQYHCNPHVADRIGYIKEITTCSYLMVIYTPRLCNDVAFLPPKETKAHSIICRVIVPEDEISDLAQLETVEAEQLAGAAAEGGAAAQPESEPEPPVINVGGVIIGGGKFHNNKKGQQMPPPPNFNDANRGRQTEVIARGKSKAEGGKVEVASDEELVMLDLDPEMVETLKREVQKMAKEKGWKIEVVDAPGQVREILGIVEGDGEDEDEYEDEYRNEDEEDEEGSQEILYKDEL